MDWPSEACNVYLIVNARQSPSRARWPCLHCVGEFVDQDSVHHPQKADARRKIEAHDVYANHPVHGRRVCAPSAVHGLASAGVRASAHQRPGNKGGPAVACAHLWMGFLVQGSSFGVVQA